MATLASSQRMDASGEESLTSLEHEVLEEYSKLAGNLETVSPTFFVFVNVQSCPHGGR